MTAVASTAPVDLAALKRRHLLAEVVEGAGVALRGRGRVRQGVCPFHEEREGSFTVYGDTERWYCFGCGEGGDVLDFIQRLEGLSLPEAIRRLDAAPPTAVVSPHHRRPAPTPVPSRDPALLTAAGRFYAGELRRSGEARAYLASRGIRLETAARLGLGYASGHGLRRFLESGGFSKERLRHSGLFTERGARFAGMVVIPEVAGGRVRWLAGRAIDPERSPRFQSLPGPKPVLGRGRLGPAPLVGGRRRRRLRLARPGAVGPARLRRPGDAGTRAGGQRSAGLPASLPRLRQRRGGARGGGQAWGLAWPLRRHRGFARGHRDVAELAALSQGRTVFEHLLTRAARTAA